MKHEKMFCRNTWLEQKSAFELPEIKQQIRQYSHYRAKFPIHSGIPEILSFRCFRGQAYLLTTTLFLLTFPSTLTSII